MKKQKDPFKYNYCSLNIFGQPKRTGRYFILENNVMLRDSIVSCKGNRFTTQTTDGISNLNSCK